MLDSHWDEERGKGSGICGLWAAGMEPGHSSWKDCQALLWGLSRAGNERQLVGAAQLPGRRAVGNGSEARSCRISVHVWDGTSLLCHGHTTRWLPRDTSGYALRTPRPSSVHRAVRMWVMACTLC